MLGFQWADTSFLAASVLLWAGRFPCSFRLVLVVSSRNLKSQAALCSKDSVYFPSSYLPRLWVGSESPFLLFPRWKPKDPERKGGALTWMTGFQFLSLPP